MHPICKLYVRICRRKWGTTLSALAYLRARQGKPFWRNRIDGLFLLAFSQHQHCQASYQRNRAPQRAPATSQVAQHSEGERFVHGKPNG